MFMRDIHRDQFPNSTPSLPVTGYDYDAIQNNQPNTGGVHAQAHHGKNVAVEEEGGRHTRQERIEERCLVFDLDLDHDGQNSAATWIPFRRLFLSPGSARSIT